jgi:rhodanese-related sulfurtransferase
MTDSLIDSSKFKRWLGDDQEIAVIDLRDEATYGKGAPLFAPNIPAARLLAEVGRLVPRRSVRTVLIDDGDSVADSAARGLGHLGYTNVRILSGGIPAWTRDGLEDLPTFDVSSQHFSKAVREAKGTPSLSARELATLYAAKENVVVLDSRTTDEFATGHVPGAISVPGAELLRRFAEVVPSQETLVLVSCAGLPRAIIGAQTLIDAGVPNRVAVLEEGTRGWRDAGLDLEITATGQHRPLSEKADAFARRYAKALIGNIDLLRIEAQGVFDWLNDDSRTTFVLDVRTPEEYALDHIAHSVSAPGGQLFAGSFRTIGVRGARTVLVDDLSGIRAITTAHWLRQRGLEIRILLHDFAVSTQALPI